MANTKTAALPLVAVESGDHAQPCPTGTGSVPRVLIVLVSPFFYGMERVVIDLFDVLRPAVDPCFLQSSRILQRNPPIIEEMRRRAFVLPCCPTITIGSRRAAPSRCAISGR